MLKPYVIEKLILTETDIRSAFYEAVIFICRWEKTNGNYNVHRLCDVWSKFYVISL